MKMNVSGLPTHATSTEALFRSYFMGGFECSTHRLRTGRRLDMIAATDHDRFAMQDYERLLGENLRVAREGVRWHLAEPARGQYDFSCALPIVRAAQATGIQVIWDLCHFGWPDYLDIFKPEFVSALAEFGAAFARWLAVESDATIAIVPINEISFFSWAAGDEGSMFPFVKGRGFELKKQLVRATLETMRAIWEVEPKARFVHIDPIIHVAASPRRPEDKAPAEGYRQSQFQSWDMISGRLCPELGGHEEYLDVIGVNFYPHNQWFYNLSGVRRIRKFTPIPRRHPLYRPFHEMVTEVHSRYRRPVFVAETGAENGRRAEWLRYVCSEVDQSIRAGTLVRGICLYPIVNHPGWLDGRHCRNALWDYADEKGRRKIYRPLASELRRWQKHFEESADTSGSEAAERRSAAA